MDKHEYTWNIPDLEQIGMLEAYGKSLVQFGEQNKNIVVLVADLMRSNKTAWFAEAFPDRFFNFGLGETNMMAAAAGFAISGKIPFVCTFACFISMRCCEHMRTDIAYPNLPVRLVATHSGVSTGAAGTTHQATEDIAIMRTLSNMTVIAPADAVETVEVIRASIDYPGPVYIRIGRRGTEPHVYQPEYEYEIGKAITLHQGNDATVIACGVPVHAALEAARKLEAEGIGLRVIDSHTIKPIDAETIIKAAQETGTIITVEEHNIIGGLGGAVAEVLADAGIGVSFKRLGIPGVYAVIGPYQGLLSRYGLDTAGIIHGVKETLVKAKSKKES